MAEQNETLFLTTPTFSLYSAVLDDDTPGGGAHYCIPCARYFVSGHALAKHTSSKPHKRRAKQLAGAKPHTQADADAAAGMGAPDDGAARRSLASMAL